MAGASLLVLIDDIAALLDDIAVMSKVAAKKTAAVVGDDLAVNANQVGGVRAERELPVVWAVAKGSVLNKVIIIPLILALSALAPWSITPMLMIGGIYLCYEGAEKVWHFISHRQQDSHTELKILADPEITDLVSHEREKIRGAIRTDFILSLEIIVIALGAFPQADFIRQAMTLCVIGFGMTIFVYGLVAVIVKMDDVGLYWMEHSESLKAPGEWLLWLAPRLLKSLTFFGTLAMFLVGGSILGHGFHHFGWHFLPQNLPVYAGIMSDLGVGALAGALVMLCVAPILSWLARRG